VQFFRFCLCFGAKAGLRKRNFGDIRRLSRREGLT